MCTGSFDDCRPSQRFNSSGDAYTRRPSRSTGMPEPAQRCATDRGCPRNSAIAFQPVSFSDFFSAIEFQPHSQASVLRRAVLRLTTFAKKDRALSSFSWRRVRKRLLARLITAINPTWCRDGLLELVSGLCLGAHVTGKVFEFKMRVPRALGCSWVCGRMRRESP